MFAGFQFFFEARNFHFFFLPFPTSLVQDGWRWGVRAWRGHHMEKGRKNETAGEPFFPFSLVGSKENTPSRRGKQTHKCTTRKQMARGDRTGRVGGSLAPQEKPPTQAQREKRERERETETRSTLPFRGGSQKPARVMCDRSATPPPLAWPLMPPPDLKRSAYTPV